MLRQSLPACLVAVCALFLFACDDGDDGGGSFSSGVETSKTVSALSDEEGQQFCDASARSFGNVVSLRKQCELGAVFFTEDAQTCRAFTDQCVQAPPEPEGEPEPGFEEEEDVCHLADAMKRMGCEETVETLEGCVGSIRSLTVSALGKIGCGDAGNTEGLEAKFADLPTALTEVPGCESIAANCPEIFGEDTPMASGMPTMPPPEEQ